jgi:hypothetical protein
MAVWMRYMGVAAVCAMGAVVRGQFAPPAPGTEPAGPMVLPLTPGSTGSSAAPPSAGGLNIGPPPVVAPSGATGSKEPLATVRPNQPMTTNAMIGFVNAEPLFANDLFRPIDGDLRQLAATARTLSDFMKGANALIGNQITQRYNESMVAAASEAQLTDQDRERINMYLALERNKLIAEHGGSVPAADRALAAEGSNVDKEMADRRRRVLKEIYFQKNLMPKVVITRQMVLEAYEKDPKRWQQVAQVELYTITLPITKWLREQATGGATLGPIKTNPTADDIKTAENKALAIAQEIIGKIKAGADFARLVEDYDSRDGARTNGGRTGTVNRGAMVDTRLEDYVFSLAANTVGEAKLLRETDWRNTKAVVVMVGKKSEAHTVSFAEAQEQITKDLRQAQLRELQVQEMDKLAQGSTVEAIDRMRDVALDAAVTRYAMK